MVSNIRSIDLSALAFDKRRASDRNLAVKRLHESVLETEKLLDYGDPFLKDLYRITGTRKFRKLGLTVQVMLGGGSIFRSRLTHVIDSSIIAQRIAVDFFKIQGTSLNLIQAAALTHDLGQSPLGYGGEKALSTKLAEHGVQFNDKNTAVKVLTEWSNQGISFRGLNPTIGLLRQIILGLDKYSKRERSFFIKDPEDLSEYIQGINKVHKLELEHWADMEGRVAVYGDAFSWICEDGMMGLLEGIFTLKEFTEASPLAKKVYQTLIQDIKDKGYDEEAKMIKDNFDVPISSRFKRFIKMFTQIMQREMISDLVNTTEKRFEENRSKIKYADDARRFDKPIVSVSDKLFKEWEKLWAFYAKKLYTRLLQANGSFENVVGRIFDHFMEHPEYMVKHYTKLAEKADNKRQRAEVVAEYMNRELTDRDIIIAIRRIEPKLLRKMLENQLAKDIDAINSNENLW